MVVAHDSAGIIAKLTWEEAAFLLSALDQYVDLGNKPGSYMYELTARNLFIAIDEAFRHKDD